LEVPFPVASVFVPDASVFFFLFHRPFVRGEFSGRLRSGFLGSHHLLFLFGVFAMFPQVVAAFFICGDSAKTLFVGSPPHSDCPFLLLFISFQAFILPFRQHHTGPFSGPFRFSLTALMVAGAFFMEFFHFFSRSTAPIFSSSFFSTFIGLFFSRKSAEPAFFCRQ